MQEEVIVSLKTKLQEEKTQNRILADEQTIYSHKVDALKREISKLEAENEGLLKKCDTVKESCVEDNRSELTRSKEKNKRIRSQLKQSEAKARELEDELFRANIERQRLKHLEEELFDARANMYMTSSHKLMTNFTKLTIAKSFQRSSTLSSQAKTMQAKRKYLTDSKSFNLQ